MQPHGWKEMRRRLREHPRALAAARTIRNGWRSVVRVLRRAALPSSERARDLVTLSTLGNHRFGNQFFQYVFLRTYAERHGLRYETTPWMGEKLFGHAPMRLTKRLPEFRERVGYGVDDAVVPHTEAAIRNVDFRGYFQYHTRYYAPYRERIRELCRPVGRYAEVVEGAHARLRSRGKTVVALHLRRGDFGDSYFFIAPSRWYLDWLVATWPMLDAPVLYIATDSPDLVAGDFAAYRPVFASDLEAEVPDFPFYPDFYLLSQADLLAISNSSFSFAAAMLNRRASRFLRPLLSEQRLVEFDPWNDDPLRRDARVEDFAHVAGIARGPGSGATLAQTV